MIFMDQYHLQSTCHVVIMHHFGYVVVKHKESNVLVLLDKFLTYAPLKSV